ncbi:MAG: glycoside hydrolase family 5 protein [Acidobacteriia bacterium]|nr:glycoside hydrolase family 5 protein [Terriglobia bacterium]
MKTNLAVLAGMVFLVMVGSAMAEKPLGDYGFVRGVCYPRAWRNDQATLERELGYAQKVQLNSTRVWLSYREHQKNPEGFIKALQNYVRTAHRLGISTMPVLWNGNGLNPDTLKETFRPEGEAYTKAVVEALKNEEGLLMWDIMNEPFMNDYYNRAPAEEKPKREAEIRDFVRYYIKFVKKLDPVNAVTVGYAFSRELESSADLVDVLSFHDYLGTRQRVENSYRLAEEVSGKYGNKPMINTEMACIARANPYDMALEICTRHKMGWYVFELMIEGYWNEVHGLFYPDGTIRDPSIIAALLGFYRNRDLKTSIKPNPNREGGVTRALQELEAALEGEPSVFGYTKTSTDKILEAAEYCANFLEAAEMVPMYEPPTTKIRFWREQPEKERDRDAIRAFAYELGLTLKKQCRIF